MLAKCCFYDTFYLIPWHLCYVVKHVGKCFIKKQRAMHCRFMNAKIVAICNEWLRFVMANLFDLSSLRGKITSAYVTLVVSTMTLGVIAFSGLLFLERQVTEGEVVADLRNAILEMRREEKNLFLYADANAFSRADEQAALSLHILQKYDAVLGAILNNADPSMLKQNITVYRTNLGRWTEMDQDDRESFQNEIRMQGHEIYLAVESLSHQERRMLEAAVRGSQWFLSVSLFLIGLSIYIFGRQLKRVAVTPLMQLESHLIPTTC